MLTVLVGFVSVFEVSALEDFTGEVSADFVNQLRGLEFTAALYQHLVPLKF